MLVANRHLKPMDIPAPGAEMSVIVRFSELFDPAIHWKRIWGTAYFEKSRQMLAASLNGFSEGRPLTDDLTELRTCLALECKRLSHHATEPNQQQLRYLRALVKAIGEIVGRGTSKGAQAGT